MLQTDIAATGVGTPAGFRPQPTFGCGLKLALPEMECQLFFNHLTVHEMVIFVERS